MLEEGARKRREQERERVERREARQAMLQERLLQAEKEAEEVWGELEEEERMENREGGRGRKRRVGSCMERENWSWRTGDRVFWGGMGDGLMVLITPMVVT